MTPSTGWIKNIPETNGKVGILGISYDGFLPLMALVNPHPALKVSVPMNSWSMAGWVTIGFTMAHSVSRTWTTFWSRLPL
jgi:predicted acyl esterase